MVMPDSTLRDVPGVLVGHDTDPVARTGCTVIAFDRLTLTAAEVRGSAPGTRELDLLQPGRSVKHADAILLTGGSAFGLRAADGVMMALRERGRGYPTPASPVPIVPAAVIYDLGVGAVAFPNADSGRRAFEQATSISNMTSGRVGVGTGAQFGTLSDPRQSKAGGFGVAQMVVQAGTVTAFVVVNALGMAVDGSLGRGEPDPRSVFIDRLSASTTVPFGQSTTLMAIVTDITCDHDTLIRCCIAAHDGLARIIVPAHTSADGDVAFASTLNQGPIDRAPAMMLTLATELTVEAALRNATSIPNGSGLVDRALTPDPE